MIRFNEWSPDLNKSTCWILLSFLLITAGCAGAGAGAMATAGRGAEVPQFTGTWEGGFDAGMIVGDLKLVLYYENDAYKGTLQIYIENQSMSSNVFNFESEGSSFTFWSNVEGIDVVYKGTIEGDELIGTLEAYSGNEVMGEGTFFFIKK